MLRGIPSRPGPRRMRRRYIHFTLCNWQDNYYYFIPFQVKPLKNILETARELGATDFVRYVEESGLQKEWTREGVSKLCTNLFVKRNLNHLKKRRSRCSLRPTKLSPASRESCAPVSTRSAATSRTRSCATTSRTAKSRPTLSRPTRRSRLFTTATGCASTNIPAEWVLLYRTIESLLKLRDFVLHDRCWRSTAGRSCGKIKRRPTESSTWSIAYSIQAPS